MSKRNLMRWAVLAAFVGLFLPNIASAVPGDLLATVTVPVTSPSCCGIGIAVDCEDTVNLFYTNSFSPFLHKMTAAGASLGSIPLTDAASGASISFGAISWDETRKKIWGGTDASGNPLSVYLIDPVTGVATFVFTLSAAGCCGFCDGIAFDGTDNSIWVSDDVASVVEHWDVSGVDAAGVGVAVALPSITPLNAAGGTLGAISGCAVGKGDRLYLGQDGLGEIVAVTKAGVFISKFATAAGRDEGLACDLRTFAPLEVLWSKDAFGNFVEAFEVEDETCVCPGAEPSPPPDLTPPTITCPPDVVVACSSPGGAVVTYPDATATDDTDPNPTVSCSPASGGTFPIGATTVTCTATDAAGNTATCSFTVTVTEGFGTIVGTLSANCSVLGVTVDAFDPGGILVGFDVTDAAGDYSIPNLPSGQTYTVSVVDPLGYTALPVDCQVDILCNETVRCDFALECPINPGVQRTIGFWKHQVGVATGGKGHAQIDAATLCGYLDLIAAHFNGNAINAVVIYVPPGTGVCDDKLAVAKTLLNLKGNVGMTARARQQLMALLLNVASGKLAQTAIISADGATVSQAITYADNLIDDPIGDHETAKTICDEINNNLLVAAGVIPLVTPDIAYRVIPEGFRLQQNFPNPFNAGTIISYALADDGPARLEIFDVLGRSVITLVDGVQTAGLHQVAWNGTDRNGQTVGSGMYFYRLTAGDIAMTKKMVLLK